MGNAFAKWDIVTLIIQDYAQKYAETELFLRLSAMILIELLGTDAAKTVQFKMDLNVLS